MKFSLKQFSAFASRNWCLAPSHLCFSWVFLQGSAGVHPKGLGFRHFHGFLINCLPVPRIWRGADFCALHADLCQRGDGCCAHESCSTIVRPFRIISVLGSNSNSHPFSWWSAFLLAGLACQQQGDCWDVFCQWIPCGITWSATLLQPWKIWK